MSEVETQDPVLEAVRRKYGFVPNLIREMNRNPAVAGLYLDGQARLAAGVLTAPEQQVVQLAVSVYNECDYCRSAHGVGAQMAGIAEADIEAVKRGTVPDDPRLRTVVAATWLTLDRRGFLTSEDLQGLEADGIDRGQLYEIVGFIALKTLSNYVNHIAHTPLDEAFRR